MLAYLFLGISIVADIFMEAIEVITSQTRVINKFEDGKVYQVAITVWNPTIANLSLMALGSSAPEILLSVIEATTTLGEPAGPLGASTIVGSAAFNLLVISAVAVSAVEEPKKIFDMGVFFTTSIFSIFAYVWLYVCLEVNSPQEVTVEEAQLTLTFMVILLILAYTADRVNACMVEKAKKAGNYDSMETHEKLARNQKKTRLRALSKEFGEQTLIEIAHKISSDKSNEISKETQEEIRNLFRDLMEIDDLHDITVGDLKEILQPDALFERFAYRKANGLNIQKEYLAIKGSKGQFEDKSAGVTVDANERVGFSCLHYSVAESNGSVKVKIIKKTDEQFSFGIRTISGSALENGNFKSINQEITMGVQENEKTIEITIIDNNEWQPDIDFTVELYDLEADGAPKLHGDDTSTRITIIDEDFPGKVLF